MRETVKRPIAPVRRRPIIVHMAIRRYVYYISIKSHQSVVVFLRRKISLGLHKLVPQLFFNHYCFPRRDWIRRAIEHRYRLLPYWHTFMYEAAATGTPAIRPLFYEFPEEQVHFISNI